MKVEDGFVIFFCKDGILYPIALTKEQKQLFDISCGLLPQPIKVITSHPQGRVEDFLRKLN